MMSFPPVMPEIFMAASTLLLLLFGLFRQKSPVNAVSVAAVFICFFTAVLLFCIGWERTILLNGLFIIDPFAAFSKFLILSGVVLSLLLSAGYLKSEEALERFEYPVLILLAGIGMMVMVSANNFLSVYLGVELQALSLYVLAAFRRDTIKSAEAAVKYYVLGALSSGMLLYGISLLYGFAGTTDFALLSKEVAGNGNGHIAFLIGMTFILSAFAFKLSSVPFHMWTPDVYEGSPTASTSFFAIVPKLAAFSLLARILTGPFSGFYDQWVQIIIFISVASMVWSAFAAIRQENIKRLMAYSAIGHMGYAMMSLLPNSPEGIGALLIYMTVYMFMVAGAFAVILYMRRDGQELEHLKDLSGLSQNHPVLAYAFAVFLFSMTGIPPMAGFFGKLFVFKAAISGGFYAVAVIGVLSSVVSAYYYIRIIKIMFFDEAKDPFDMESAFCRKVVILLVLVCILGFVVYPAPFVDTSFAAVQCLFSGT